MNNPITTQPDPAQPRSLRFKIGVLLLLINVPLGWGGLALCTALYAKTHHIFWEAIGIGCYGLSWALLGLGIWMAGPIGKQLVGELIRKFKAHFKRP